MDSDRPEVKENFSNHTDNIHTVCFSPDQTKLCSSGGDEKIIFINLQDNYSEKTFSSLESDIFGSDFSCCGDFLVTGCVKNIVRVWNVTGNESGKSAKLEGHTREVNCVLYFRNDPKNVVSGSGDQTIKIWSVERKKEISTISCTNSTCMFGVICIDILPDNQTLVSGEGEEMRIWDLRSGKCVKTLSDNTIKSVNLEENAVKFHPKSFSLASGGVDNSIKIFDIRTFRLLQKHEIHSEWVTSVSFHPSGKYLISGSRDKTIKVFDLLEKKILFILEAHKDNVECIQFSPDGKLFASGGLENKVILWNFPLGRMTCEEDFDEEERVNYLIQQDLIGENVKNDFCEQNVLKIRIDNFCILRSYKLFFV